MKKATKQQSPLKVALYLVFIGLFAGSLVAIIAMLDANKPSMITYDFSKYATTFERNVFTVNSTWRAQGATNIVILVHYDMQSRETGRTPVKVNHRGWPSAMPADDSGCERLWRTVMMEPLMLDGMKVYSEYFSTRGDSEEEKARCRFRVASGESFSYFFHNGRVEFSE